MSFLLYPKPGIDVYSDDDVLIPSSGISLSSMSKYYKDLVFGGYLLTQDPGVDPSGVPLEDFPVTGAINVKSFGAKGDGITDDTAAWDTWLASVCTSDEKVGYVPPGSYRLSRQNTENITANGVTIVGTPASRVFFAGTFNGQVGYFNQNAFQATGRDNLTFRNIGFGAITLVALYGCNNVSVFGCSGNGNVTGLGHHENTHWGFGIYLDGCSAFSLMKNQLSNFESEVYLGKTGSALNRRGSIVGNNIYQTKVSGRTLISGDYPVGVYVYYAEDVTISGNTFANIRSAVSGGSPSTGCGFGVYEGDGSCENLIVTSNTFVNDTAGDYRMDGVWTYYAKNAVIANNTIRYSNSAAGIGINANLVTDVGRPGAQNLVIESNTINTAGTSARYGITASISGEASDGSSVVIRGNTLEACRIEASKSDARPADLSIEKNSVSRAQLGAGIVVSGSVGYPFVSPSITGNTVSAALDSGIYVASTVRAIVHDNKVLDCNTGNETVNENKYCGIVFPSHGYGASLKNNHIENRHGLGGHMLVAMSAFSSVQRFAWKYDNSNTSAGLPANVPAMSNLFYSSPPSGGWDWRRGETAHHAAPTAGGVPSWVCTQRVETTLGAQLNAGDTSVTVGSTSGMLGGDVFQVIADPSTLDANSYLNTVHYYGEVQSITDGTTLVLTAPIPVGYTFTVATSQVAVLRWKAAAVLAV